MGEILLLEILKKTNFKWGIYNPIRNLPVGSWKRARLPFRSTGQRSNFWPLRLPIDRDWIQRAMALWPVDRPVDRSRIQSAYSLSGRPLGRPEAFLESRALWRSTDPVDRPPQLGCVHALCTSVDRPGRPPTATVDRSGRPPVSQSSLIWDEKLGYFDLNKIP